MREKSDSELDSRLSEAEFRDALARATELDERWSGAIEIDEFREVALEAGISESAISQVLRDLIATRQIEPSNVPQSKLGSMVATGLALGVTVGAILALAKENALFSGDEIYFVVFGLALIPALAAAVVLSGSRKHRRFQLMNLVMWAIVAIILVPVGGPTNEFADLFFVCGWLTALGSVLGAGIISLRNLSGGVRRFGRRLLGFLGGSDAADVQGGDLRDEAHTYRISQLPICGHDPVATPT